MNEPNWWVVAGLIVDTLGVFAVAGFDPRDEPGDGYAGTNAQRLGTSTLAWKINLALGIDHTPPGDEEAPGVSVADELKYKRMAWFAVGVGFALQLVGQFYG